MRLEERVTEVRACLTSSTEHCFGVPHRILNGDWLLIAELESPLGGWQLLAPCDSEVSCRLGEWRVHVLTKPNLLVHMPLGVAEGERLGGL